MLLQAITIPGQRYDYARRSVDFIQRYIFPGGSLPSTAVINQHLDQDTDMQLIDLHDIGLHYASTLADWRRRFYAQLEQVQALGFDEVFCRLWDYYLCYCEGGFREQAISTVQVLAAKPQARVNEYYRAGQPS